MHIPGQPDVYFDDVDADADADAVYDKKGEKVRLMSRRWLSLVFTMIVIWSIDSALLATVSTKILTVKQS